MAVNKGLETDPDSLWAPFISDHCNFFNRPQVLSKVDGKLNELCRILISQSFFWLTVQIEFLIEAFDKVDVA